MSLLMDGKGPLIIGAGNYHCIIFSIFFFNIYSAGLIFVISSLLDGVLPAVTHSNLQAKKLIQVTFFLSVMYLFAISNLGKARINLSLSSPGSPNSVPSTSPRVPSLPIPGSVSPRKSPESRSGQSPKTSQTADSSRYVSD